MHKYPYVIILLTKLFCNCPVTGPRSSVKALVQLTEPILKHLINDIFFINRRLKIKHSNRELCLCLTDLTLA